MFEYVPQYIEKTINVLRRKKNSVGMGQASSCIGGTFMFVHNLLH
jgi:hypothetical protein